MKKPPHFGAIPGIAIGEIFADRRAVKAAGLHRDTMAGIAWTQRGAEAIVVSGGYEDDQDGEELIIYTGHGGNDRSTGGQIGDQRLHRGNLAMARSCLEGLPVRVIRGASALTSQAPRTGYRYDGIYYVDSYWRDRGKAGFAILRFRLVRDRAAPLPAARGSHSSGLAESPIGYEVGEPAQRIETTVQRIVRGSDLAQQIKILYDYRCQTCDTRLETIAGPYAEGAHIRPLGHPHDGPDSTDNILCLCPNCHVRLDFGAIVIADDLVILDATTLTHASGLRTHLRTDPGHPLEPEHLRYHRGLFGRPLPARDG